MATATGADCYTPAGYESCARCGQVFVEGTRRTGRCQGCDALVAAQGGQTVVVRIGDVDVERRPNRAKRKRRRLTPVEKAQRRAFNRARSRAYGELARRHPDEYAALLEHYRAERDDEDVG